MSAPAIRKWRIIVAAKARRCERIEADLARERQALAERQTALDEAVQARTEAQTRQAEHEAGIVSLLDGAGRLATSLYLLHDAWRGPLKEALDEARAAERKQRTALERQQAKVAELQAALSRAKGSLDECRRKLDTLLRAAAVAAELAADEEAAENLLARRHAR
ncbi:hypothetical protein [Paraburkholderia rhynchosiae]|uniref:Type III secretion protein HrpB7 n=1 Tax=Paraburkholderia rhynchosiae TaxID=487049 RepID=A0A2N7W5X3_9BURK|nr:hypothetical protein [Paraburkholderia rhynchosiae]PMS24807.1 hypothetical protein C0Z16_30155 [Paraburkholderia rhynchosiae]CAB3725673.1 hypothetical protein LMG27174_05343 [Paraburkholderia rhynchosiae]